MVSLEYYSPTRDDASTLFDTHAKGGENWVLLLLWVDPETCAFKAVVGNLACVGLEHVLSTPSEVAAQIPLYSLYKIFTSFKTLHLTTSCLSSPAFTWSLGKTHHFVTDEFKLTENCSLGVKCMRSYGIDTKTSYEFHLKLKKENVFQRKVTFRFSHHCTTPRKQNYNLKTSVMSNLTGILWGMFPQ